jgi:hypothetical protein
MVYTWDDLARAIAEMPLKIKPIPSHCKTSTFSLKKNAPEIVVEAIVKPTTIG